MNNMRKLMEAVEQLNEYLVREGESIETLLRLNVFGDMGFGEDPELFSDDYEKDEEGGMGPSQAWSDVVYDYQSEAEERYLQIKDEAEKGRKLTDAEAQAAENTWYDGSDAYQSEKEAADYLPGIYANQLNVVENILHGLVDDEWLDEANQGGKTEYSGAKKGKGAYHGRKKEFMGRLKHGKRFRRKVKTQVGEEVVEIIGEDRQFVDSAAMVRWMLSGLKKIQYDFQFTDDSEELFDNLMDEIDNLIEEMENAKIKTYPSRPTHGRRRGPRASRRPGPNR